jgi:hypothetical protein
MKLRKIDGKTLRDWVAWLRAEDCGCCHMKLGDTEFHEVDVCVGWHESEEEACGKCKPVWKVAWKIGWQPFNNGMQTDLDIDFDMPHDESGVYDTLTEIGDLKTMKEWNMLAFGINATAKKVFEFADAADRRRAGRRLDG